jgi:RHS repeat-associated protein
MENWDWTNGLGYTPNRTHRANHGRWLSPDPLAGDISNPQSLNRYAYVMNNPATLNDPSGLGPFDCDQRLKSVACGNDTTMGRLAQSERNSPFCRRVGNQPRQSMLKTDESFK